MIHFAYIFQCEYFALCLAEVSQNKSICPHMTGRFLLLQGAQLQGQLSGNAHHISGFLYRRPLFWKSVSSLALSKPAGTGEISFLMLKPLFPDLVWWKLCTWDYSMKKKNYMQTWDISELWTEAHGSHGKNEVINWGTGKLRQPPKVTLWKRLMNNLVGQTWALISRPLLHLKICNRAALEFWSRILLIISSQKYGTSSNNSWRKI